MPSAGTTRCADEEIVPRLRGLLEESVELHKISDVPIGAFLSGGLDSSAVVGLMSRRADKPVRTYCIGFDDAPEGYDERKYARTAAQSFSTRHLEFVVKGSKVAEELPPHRAASGPAQLRWGQYLSRISGSEARRRYRRFIRSWRR